MAKKPPLRKNPVEDAVETVRALIDTVTHPNEMTVEEYDEFLDQMYDEIQGRICCRADEQELENEEGS
jgi:hypothetical protein